jgi:adenosine 3'-phospho 5'-phosphosulfate transporter B2
MAAYSKVPTSEPPDLERNDSPRKSKQQSDPDPSNYKTIIEFAGCFVALQVSYLMWGIMQELIMTTKFEPTPRSPEGMFPSATFCVFSNRVLAIMVAAVACMYLHGTVKSSAPLSSFTPCALSNTVSSFSQYKALSYVSFSLQTLFKSMKVIPVMLMGKFLKGTTYSVSAYVEAIVISMGVSVFSFGSERDPSKDATQETDLLGFCLLCGYVLSDSFTSQWQSRIYRDYGKIDHFHMMFGVNVSAIIITIAAMIVGGDLPVVIEFMVYNPNALWYNVLTAITSTTGQMAIFYTIKRFGPIAFTIIMTTRQMLSILLSNMLFGHSMTLQMWFGALLVFLAVFHRYVYTR